MTSLSEEAKTQETTQVSHAIKQLTKDFFEQVWAWANSRGRQEHKPLSSDSFIILMKHLKKV